MKNFLICLAVSFVISSSVLSYFFFQEGSLLSLDKLLSPLAIVLFIGIVLGIASALLQIYSMLFKSLKS